MNAVCSEKNYRIRKKRKKLYINNTFMRSFVSSIMTQWPPSFSYQDRFLSASSEVRKLGGSWTSIRTIESEGASRRGTRKPFI